MPWTERYGGGSGSGRNAGCCDSCCRSSFDEDAFDAQVKRDLEKTRDPNAQPAPTVQMTPVQPQAEGATGPGTTTAAVAL